MSEDFGVGFGYENMSEGFKFLFNFCIVLDDSVLNDCNLILAVYVRVSIDLCRSAVGCPPDVAQPDSAGEVV